MPLAEVRVHDVAGSSGAEASPFATLQNAMIIGALPFAMVMVLMMISLAKALYKDSLRGKDASTRRVVDEGLPGRA